jgi:site-specific DNA-methyltransferase (adenine-specific)
MLPKPFYQDDAVTIYHGDCREILPQLDVKVDLVLTDPPYGIDYQSSWRIDWARKPKIQGDTAFPMWLFDLKPSKAMFVWCRWDILPSLPLPKSFIVWDKGVHSMGDLQHEYGRQWEACAFYPQAEHEFIRRPVDIIRCMRIPPEQLTHPNEKPIGAITPIIKANKGDLILDPFLGSGTTAVAAKILGRKCIGIEIEEKYCEIAAKRCAQSVMRLEIAPQENTKQEALI